ncbi:MAG: L-threonylcarbamoyladenylate synthase [Bacteroides sp.]|nr:L-threonylcarbamoyladenylate synthase [Bacteroides sp.]MCM1380100.1 L-threonylcarbamoyladenylate synthase [Bacteroides sp.]MCM1445667.1 L-threonylcarbamoyladenylate synthase [Prevotella sp.]
MIDRNDIDNALATLKRGGVILYPTDTVWGIGCDATNAAAVERIFALKRRSDAKALICLLDSPDSLERWVGGVPAVAYELLDAAVEPLTVIYDGAYVPPLAANLPAEDGSLAIRIPDDEFCRELCRRLRKPLVSTSANISGQPTPKNFAEISPEIKNGVDYVCTSGRAPRASRKTSTIIKLTEDARIAIIRC